MTEATERAVLAGGCFWGVQELVRKLPGVLSTRVGYTGGDVPNATYRNHGTHAEGIEIIFDPSATTYRDLLEFFFQIHDPTTKNRQGNDVGLSYRSAIYYTSDEQRTSVDFGFEGCPDRPAVPPPASYGAGVVTPHASFLALRFAPNAALGNLDKLRRNFDAYGPGGFYDAVNVTTGAVSKAYLALDQGMVLAAATNALRGDVLRNTFSRGPMSALRPVMAMEDWTDVRSGQ